MVITSFAELVWPETPPSPSMFHIGKSAFKTSLDVAWSNLLGYLLKVHLILRLGSLEPEIYHTCALLNKMEKW